MLKQKLLLQALLSASLLTFMSNTYAQESVSSFEQSLNSSSIAENAPAETARYDMDALTSELKNRGWDIQRESDGSLILIPQIPAGNSSNKKADNSPSNSDQWQQLQQKFQNAGWTAVIDADGAMRLTPPTPVPAAQPKENNPIKSSENSSFKGMQQKLKETGWNITNNSDGSILLYPPEKAAAKEIHSCPGIKPLVTLSLPVDTWQEAHDIAQGWLSSVDLPNTMVGKIRKIFNVYIISIVADKAPFVLKHQIAIKNNNGAVIVLN